MVSVFKSWGHISCLLNKRISDLMCNASFHGHDDQLLTINYVVHPNVVNNFFVKSFPILKTSITVQSRAAYKLTKSNNKKFKNVLQQYNY